MSELLTIRACTDLDHESVVELGNRFKKSLGLYPKKAILAAIHQGCVYGAFEAEQLVGYALFALPRNDIRLVQLCIDPNSRRSGVARRLIDEIEARHGDRMGIRLKCRRDYPAHNAWPKLGFQAQSLPVGRGKDKAEMTAWWRPFGHADLFSSAFEDDARIKAALDTNVVLDVLMGRNSATTEYLNSPVIDGEIVYCVSRSVKNEISQVKSPEVRRATMSRLAQFEELASDIASCEATRRELLYAVNPSDLDDDTSLADDARVLAEAIVGGVSVLATNDDNAARVFRPIATRYGVDVLHPSQLVVKIDELKNNEQRASDRIQNTEYSIGYATPGIDRELDHLISTHGGESKAKFRGLLRSASGHSSTRLVHSEAGGPADGLVVTEASNGVLNVKLLRARSSPLASDLLKQLIFQLRHDALKLEAARIVITDPFPGGGTVAEQLFRDEGARMVKGRWTIEVVDAQMTPDELQAQTVGPWNMAPWLGSIPQEPEEFALLERSLWPLKIVDAPLPSYVVPIKQHFASELLGYDQPLLNRSSGLGISRRHVYYKSGAFRPEAPGRILWYASGPLGGSIVAASQLVSSHQASARSLHARFRKYGVWSLADIETHSGKSGRAVALRFGDTEVFKNPVQLANADSIVRSFGGNIGTVPTARRIPDAAFHEIYSKGMGS